MIHINITNELTINIKYNMNSNNKEKNKYKFNKAFMISQIHLLDRTKVYFVVL